MRVLKSDADNIIVYEYPQDDLIKQSGAFFLNKYLSIFGTIDIETSNVEINGEINGVMYCWQVCIGDTEGKTRHIYVGRKWSDLIRFFAILGDMYHLTDKRKMAFYIHNAAFEFQFFRSVFNIGEMFASKKRVPITFNIDDVFEMRCSYKLSNMGLAKFCESEQVQHGKRTGYDYNKTRYSDTFLNDEELLYCVDDVLGLHEAICHTLKTSHDTLASIPKTSTGYVRREARERVRENKHNVYVFKDTALSDYEYKLCKAATRGGNTHANVLYSGEILGTDEKGAPCFVDSYDKKSSYPYEMVTGEYPCGRFQRERSDYSVERFEDFLHADAANVFHIVIKDVRLKSGVYFPYIAKNKCQLLPAKANSDYWYDNGRVIKAPYLRMVINEIDAAIIESQYDYSSIDIIDHIVTDKDLLCQEYRDYVYELFKVKCELEGQDEYYYNKFKNKINALFGMMLTDVTREEIIYSNNDWLSEMPPTAQALFKYYKSYNSFLSYQHGLYVTSNARLSLEQGLRAVGIDGVYTDTDSVKFMGNHKEKFNALNAEIIERSKRVGVLPVTVRGKTSTLGVWEHDAAYSAFITYGAKKYAYRYSMDSVNKPKKRGEIGVTVAGLNKNSAARYLREHGGLAAFDAGKYTLDSYKTGLEFGVYDSGRTTSKYNDDIMLKEMNVNGHDIELTSNIAILPTTYTLGITKEYSDLMEMKSEVFT